MKINLSQNATRWLRDMLVQSEWKANENRDKASKDAYRTGKLLYEVIPEVEDLDPKADKAGVTAWADKMLPEWEITDRDFKMVQRCIQFFDSKGTLHTTKHVHELRVAFNVIGSTDE